VATATEPEDGDAVGRRAPGRGGRRGPGRDGGRGQTDFLARYGGEEFAALLPDCELDDAMEIAERLRTAQVEGTCSIGVAALDGREEATALVARADRALYAAKAAGRDRCLADRPATATSRVQPPVRG
jgi:predicted signal transduction protein with EAL and GGDEF domain